MWCHFRNEQRRLLFATKNKINKNYNDNTMSKKKKISPCQCKSFSSDRNHEDVRREEE